jgi:hypothetical protein
MWFALLLVMQVPPHGAAPEALPLRIETFSVRRLSLERPTKNPLKQLRCEVTCSTIAPSVAIMKMPWRRKVWTMPGPRILTRSCTPVEIPSNGEGPGLGGGPKAGEVAQPSGGLAAPDIVKPSRNNVMSSFPK